MKRHFVNFILVLFCILLTNHPLIAFDQIVIWGHKKHSHTHHYIHNGFYIACQHLGFSTYWFDDEEDTSDFDFTNTLFITEGQVDRNIPLREDCKYMIHNPSSNKYQTLHPGNCIYFQVYTDSVLSLPNLIKIDTCIYYDIPARCIYFPWATDLLPHEIEQIKKNQAKIQVKNKIYWIGTIGDGEFGNIHQITPFKNACEKNGIEFIHILPGGASREDSSELIGISYMAPTIVGEWQSKVGYIPCRIFKNISYGKMGITNSSRVQELFENKLVYNSDTNQLFYDAKKRLESIKDEEIYELMDLVKTKHTYINRIQTLLDFLEIVGNAYPSTPKFDLSVCALFQDEAFFLKEWLEFHILVGVQHFYLYNNRSTDQFLEILQPYIDRGEVELFNWDVITNNQKDYLQNLQLPIYNDALKKAQKSSHWIAFIDLDEFLFPVKVDNLVSFLHNYSQFAGLAVNWQVYGTSGYYSLESEKLIIENLVWKAPHDIEMNKTVKLIVQPKRVKSIGNPHVFDYKDDFFAVNSKKKPVKNMVADTVEIDEIRINHYWFGTLEWFLYNKIPRREKWGIVLSKDVFEEVISSFNKIKDESILKYIPLLKNHMQLSGV